MDANLLPGVVAAIGGSALLGVIVVTEARQQASMRVRRVRCALTFPLDTAPDRARVALEALAGFNPDVEIVAEVAAEGDGICHRLYLPTGVYVAATAQLRAAIPALRIVEIAPEPSVEWTLALTVTVPRRAVLRSDDPEGGRALLAALLPLRHEGERISVRWGLRPGRPADRFELSAAPRETERHHERAWQAKLAGPGLFVSGMVLVAAADERRARALANRIVAVLRSRRQGGDKLRLRRRWRAGAFPRATRRSGWMNPAELLPCLGWPVGDVPVGVHVGAARQIAPRKELARHGRPLLVSERHGKPRPVALSVEAARHGVLLLGPTGSGKSAVAVLGILSDIEAGFGGFFCDPKGDAIRDLLDRVPAEHAERIAVIDPADPGPIPGIDLFAAGDADARADMVLSVFRGLSDSWGPRLDALLRLGLQTLCEVPGASLLDLPRLYLDPSARRAAVARLHAPLLVGQWQAFDALSDAARREHSQPVLTRAWSILSRPATQAVLAQPNARLNVARLLAERKWLLLSTAGIGAPAARLIAATVTYAVWSAVAARAALPPEQRYPLSLVFDELTALTDQGLGIEALAEQGRGHNALLTVATQAAGRLPEAIRHSLFANLSTLVSFRAGADEAARIARELPGIEPRDLIALDPFEVAARVGTGRGAGSVVVTGHTEPLGEPTGQAGHIRTLSGERWGRSRQEIQAAIRERYGEPAASVDPADDLGRTERRP